jgi:hypothetical protein
LGIRQLEAKKKVVIVAHSARELWKTKSPQPTTKNTRTNVSSKVLTKLMRLLGQFDALNVWSLFQNIDL